MGRITDGKYLRVPMVSNGLEFGFDLFDLPRNRFPVVFKGKNDRPARLGREFNSFGANIPRGASVEHFQANGPRSRSMKKVQQLPEDDSILAADYDETLFLRSRFQLERHLRDNAERPQGADVEFAKIIARDILDNASAGLDLLALVIHHADADDIVSKRAKPVAAR